jgi:L-amino acid N-acyltransferase YncA
MQVRPATVKDAGQCAEIYAPFVTDSWVSFESVPPDKIEMEFRIERALEFHDWLVADIGGKITGYAYGSGHRSREAYQHSCDVSVYVDQAFSRQGIGRTLYDALFARLKERKFHALFAGIALPNDASVGLHQSSGFTSVGIYREVGWKMGAWRDVQWMQRLL